MFLREFFGGSDIMRSANAVNTDSREKKALNNNRAMREMLKASSCGLAVIHGIL